MRLLGFTLLLLVGLSCAQAASRVITCSTADHGLGEGSPPAIMAAGGTTIRIGANNNAVPGGRNAVMIFPLPAISTGEGIASAQLVFTVSGRFGSPQFNGDLWGIGFLAETTPILSYLEADAGDSGNIKLADDVLTPSTGAGPVGCNTHALAEYLRGFYSTNKFGGHYVFLRLNPDADAGTNSIGWSCYAAESAANAATLTLTTTNSLSYTNSGCTNFIVIVTDDQRWDALGVVQREMGSRARFPWFTNGTPNLDRLAAEGIRFRNGFVPLSLCSPSRAAIQTGCYNHINGIINNSTPFPTNSVTFATQLRQAGYITAWVGKWHMGGQLERPGYDFAASYKGQGNYFNTTFYVNGVETPTYGWVDDVSTDYALSFIETNLHKPFALVIGYKTTHSPRSPPSRATDLYVGQYALPVPNLDTLTPWDTIASKPATNDLQNYFRCVSAMDDGIGRILDALDLYGVTTNTMVIFLGDNGYFLGEHGRGDKRSAYEESIRVPLLIRYPPWIRQAGVCDDLALSIDIAPTILDAAGVPIPPMMQGASWRALFSENPSGWRQSFLCQYFLESNYDTPTLIGVRTAEAKLVEYPGHPDWSEMFLIAEDPYETNNLFANPDWQDLRQTLKADLNRLCWQSGLAASLDSPVSTPSGWQIPISGGIGPRYRIEATTNLHLWSPLQEIKMLSSTNNAIDPVNTEQRFYRATMIED